MNNRYKIGFIGCGEMASAIIRGVLNKKFTEPENILASKASINGLNEKSKELGIRIVTDNQEVANFADIIFIATKPSQVADALKGISITSNKLIVSIAAGVSINKLTEFLPKTSKIIRVMPNTPSLIGEGMSAMTKNSATTEEDARYIKSLLETIGKCVELENESQIDVVTAISGSGPAFFYKIIHEFALAGEKLGLDYDKSLLLATQTALGSAKMIFNKTTSMDELISSVTTKGGCTEVGINTMDKSNLANIIYETIKNTAEKAKNLGK